MGSIDLTTCLKVAQTAADSAAEALARHFGNLKNVSEKFQAGLVSDADREAERIIVEKIREKFPEHGILGEEYGMSTKTEGPALWMIDPLDGTTNFIHQFPFFCISIGLEYEGELVLGLVDAPLLKMRFHAIKGQGAHLNGQPIHVSQRQEFRDGLFATGLSGHDDLLKEQLELVERTVRNSRGIRRAGAAALDLCFVAQGVFDAFWERNLAPWDTAAGVAIATEAGAITTDMDGGKYDPRLRSILCGQPRLHAELLKCMKDIRGETSNWTPAPSNT